MKLSKFASALVLAGGALASSGAFAAPSITNTDGVLTPFGGFDWDSGGAAYSNDLAAAVAAGGGNFTIVYAGWAGALKCQSGCTNLLTPGLDNNANGVANGTYEYTTYQTITGQILSVDPTGGVGGGPKINYKIIGGSWDIYYDTTPDANAVAGGNWTGFKDGVNVLTGFWGTTFGSFDTDLGTNSVGLKGQVAANGTNNLFINPDLNGTSLSSTLQLFGFDSTNFNAPNSIEGLGILSNANGGTLFQADANQTFTEVPEPTGLLLAGMALAGLGATTRRRRG